MQENVKSNKKKTIIISATIIAVIGVIIGIASVESSEEKALTYLEKGEYAKLVDVYNEKIDTSSSEGQNVTTGINDLIVSSVDSWASGDLTYEEATLMLEEFTKLNDSELAAEASDNLLFIKTEHESSELYIKAEKQYADEKYLAAMQIVMSIDKTYSQYDSTQELYNDAKAVYLMEIAFPSSIQEYKDNIQDIEDYLSQFNDEELADEKTRLENELAVFRYTIDIINEAQQYFDDEKYKKAFSTLEYGLLGYPGDRHLTEKKDELTNIYIISVLNNVEPLIEEEKYKEALTVIEDAQSTYECEEFAQLEEYIRDEKSIFHRMTSSVKDKFTVLAVGWNEEVAEVKNDGTGAYIMKSGEKLFLGDYSDEDITVLSTTGDIASAFVGADFMFDVRDLVYDVQHWGEEEYFVVHLATDAIALVPVIGAIKYIKYLKKIDKVEDHTGNLAKDISKTQETKKGVVKHYQYEPTINQYLKDKTHGQTGVLFKEKKVKYSDGRKLKVVVPVFDSTIDIQLKKELYKSTFTEQQKWLNQELAQKIKKDNNLKKSFSEEQIIDIESGATPQGFTWHHNEKEGLMQLVDTVTHDQTAHTGGMSLWGRGYND